MLSETIPSTAARTASHVPETTTVADRLQGRTLDAAIIRLVNRYTGVSNQLLFHPSRCSSNVALARQLAMYLLHVCASRTMAEVGALFARDRTTVAHACGKIEDMRDCVAFDADICGLEDAITTLMADDDDRSDPAHVLQ